MSQLRSSERDRIDNVILHLERQLHELRRQRNALAPISRLPEELLLAIFYHCQEEADCDFDWIREVTHVCHCWREIALSIGLLWSDPEFCDPRLAPKMLARSGKSPLRIFFRWGKCRDTRRAESLELLGNTLAYESYRIRTLDLCLPPRKLAGLLELATNPASILEELFLTAAEEEPPLEIGDVAYILDNVFPGEIPMLRVLQLTSCCLKLDHHRYTNLHSLYIENGHIASIVHLHSTLRSMPYLKKLCLHKTIADVPATGYQPSPIYMPTLVELYLTDSAHRLAVMLSPIMCSFPIIPFSRSLYIECTDMENTSVDYVSQISAWISSSLAAPLTGLSLNGAQNIRGFTDHTAPDTEYSIEAPVELQLSDADEDIMDEDGLTTPTLMVASINNLPLMRVEDLLISGLDLTEGQWSVVLQRLPRVSCLRFEESSADNLNVVLRSLHQTQAALPGLRKVMLDHTTGIALADMHIMRHVLQSRLPLDDQGARAVLSFSDYESNTIPELYALLAQFPRLVVLCDGQELESSTG